MYKGNSENEILKRRTDAHILSIFFYNNLQIMILLSQIVKMDIGSVRKATNRKRSV